MPPRCTPVESRPARGVGARSVMAPAGRAPLPQERRRRSRPSPPATAGAARRTGSGVGSRTPQRGGLEARCPGRGRDVDRRRPHALPGPGRRVPSRPAVATQPVDDVVDAAERALREQLDDRLGKVGGVRRRAPLVGDDAQRLAGRGGRSAAVEDLRREVVAGRVRTATRCARCRAGRPRRPVVRVASPARSPASFDAPYGLAGCRARRAARSRGRPSRAAVEDLVRRDHDEVDAALGAGLGEDAGGGAVARQRRAPGRARSRRHRSRRRHGRRPPAGPGRAARRCRPGASRSNRRRSQAIGPNGPVNGASSRAAMSARPSRPRAPVTATRTSGRRWRRAGLAAALPSASRCPYWRS